MSGHPFQDLTAYPKDVLKRCKTVYEQELVEFHIHEVDEAGDSVESDLESEERSNGEGVIETDVETIDDDLTETTDHEEGYESSEKSTDESDVEATAFQQDSIGTLPSVYLSKTQRRKVRRNLNEIGEAYIAEDDIREKNKKTIPRGIM